MSTVPKHHYRLTYTPDDLAALFAEFQIPADRQQDVACILEDAAAIWRWYRATGTSVVAPAKANSALRKLAKQAQRLSAALSDLPEPAQRALCVEQERLGSDIVMTMETDRLAEKRPFLNVAEADGTLTPILPDMAEIAQMIDALGSMAIEAANIPPGRIGTKRDHALRMWMANIEKLWNGTLSRPFSRDVTSDGEPISEAARFCVRAFRFVSTDTAPSRVLNEMKLHIRAKRRKATGRISAKNEA